MRSILLAALFLGLAFPVSLTAGATAPAGSQGNTINTERFFELVDALKEKNRAFW